jgi:DNA-binding response OmpR family regulator
MSARVESVTVLLVEDNRADAHLLRSWLSESVEPRFRASHVTRLADANSRADAIAYDAVVLDLALPDSDGLGTVAKFRAANPDTAIVVVTGSDDVRLAASTVQLGAHEFASKHALDARTLSTTITRAIARHQLTAGSERLLAQIRDNTSKLRNVLHGHPDGIVLHDSAARVLYANAAAELLLGCRAGQPLPTPLVRPDVHWRGAMRVENESGDTSRSTRRRCGGKTTGSRVCCSSACSGSSWQTAFRWAAPAAQR